VIRGWSLAAVVVLSCVGCGAREDPVVDRAEHFVRSLEAGNGAAACADLAEEARSALEEQEERPCAEVIGEQDLPTAPPRGAAEVYGSMAQVRTAQDTVFLSRFADGWRIVAIGCTRSPLDEPYRCAVEVG
jgi:hypothetical protein